MKLKPVLVRVHKWLSLAAATLWLIQALTGVIIVFHWEIDDATISAPHRPTDLHAIDRGLARLAPPGSGRTIGSIWTSAGAADRWDVNIDDAYTGIGATVRIDGAGDVIRNRPDGERFADGGWIDTLVVLHQTLLGGDTGSWIVGISGILLFTNILIGLIVAWPRARMWRQSLRPPMVGRAPARFYGWHRAIGLWVGIPALLLVSAGISRVFAEGFEKLVGAPPVEAPVLAPVGPGIPFSRAVEAAMARHPDATLSGIDFPSADDATWKIRVREPGEPVRAYGNTTVFLSGNDGHVIADFDARDPPISRRIADITLPLHTGEIAGTAGRLAVMAIGLWLLSMIGIGLSLWWTRRSVRRGSR